MLNWEWEDKMGEVVYDDGKQLNIYKGNAYAIAIHEYYDDDGAKYYHPVWCWTDKNDMKRSLGIEKGFENTFADDGVVKIRLNVRYKDVPAIVTAIAKTKMPITIELYYAECGEEESR